MTATPTEGSGRKIWHGESEAGVALLARAAVRPSLLNLCLKLLPGLKPSNVVQVSGEAGCGKSLLLLHLLSQTLLPDDWHGMQIGGCNAGALFIDTDLRFNILQLSVMMEMVVKRCITSAKQNVLSQNNRNIDTNDVNEQLIGKLQTDSKIKLNEQKDGTLTSNFKEGNSIPPVSEVHNKMNDKRYNVKNKALANLLNLPRKDLNASIKQLVKRCIKNLVYLKCHNSVQFASTLITLDNILANNPLVSLVCVDSMSNFYWHDRAYTAESSTWQKTEQFYNKILKAFVEIVRKNGIVLVGVTQLLYLKQKRVAVNDMQSNISIDNALTNESGQMEMYSYMGKEWRFALNYQIHIKRQNRQSDDDSLVKRIYCMEVQSSNHCCIANATYHEYGVKWL